jgi:mono/diheme cytochrome c family protein
VKLLLLFLCACHPQDIDPLEQQSKFKAYSANAFFADGRAMRDPPAGTVPRERILDDEPVPVDAALLALGKESYTRSCAACHGTLGDGDSVVAAKMALEAPPTFHQDRLRAMPASEIFRRVSEGYGLMPRYSTTLSSRERWATVAYVRALQLSQNVSLAGAPPDIHAKVGP